MVKQKAKKSGKAVEIPLGGEIIVFDDPTKRRQEAQGRKSESGSRSGKVTPLSLKGKPPGGAASKQQGMSRMTAEEAALEESSRKITEGLLKEVEEFSQWLLYLRFLRENRI